MKSLTMFKQTCEMNRLKINNGQEEEEKSEQAQESMLNQDLIDKLAVNDCEYDDEFQTAHADSHEPESTFFGTAEDCYSALKDYNDSNNY